MAAHITANDVRQYVLCSCALYLEHHGPAEERAAAHAFVEHLMELGLDHERKVVATLPHVAVPDGPLSERAETTLRLLRQGVDRIYHPVLVAEDLLGVPDFVERTDTPSELGPFSYRPVDVKISTSPKPEQEAQLAFYGLLLDRVQGVVPQTGDLILVDQQRATVDLDEPVESVSRVVDDVREVREGRRESPTLSSECGMCPWHDHCLRTLYASRDVSLIDGLSRAKKPGLIDLGYTDLQAIAESSPEDLCQAKGVGAKTAERMVPQAAELLEQRPRLIAPPKLPDAGFELYLDMECQQQTQVIYLIGVLECGEGESEEFRAFVAETPDDEGGMWDRFLGYLHDLSSDPVIYHYHNFEATHLQKLADRHGIDPESEARLFGNLVDLHAVLKSSVVLPVHSYGLKPVAKWMGFRWRETEAGCRHVDALVRSLADHGQPAIPGTQCGIQRG